MLIPRVISILYCAEGEGYSDDEIMQHECMLEFAYEKDQINGPLTRADGDHCKLFGVLCKKGMITQIDWMKEHDMVVDSLHWIPPTVEVFRVHKNLSHAGGLETRYLPDCLQILSAASCNISGTIDLESLPCQLQSMELHDNQISGTARLTRLPSSLVTLTLHRNMCTQVVVSNADLPEHLEKVTAFGMLVEKFDVVLLRGKRVDQRVHIE